MNIRNDHPLTIDQIRSLAPSAFATSPSSDRSSRYTYIPTIDVIEGMAQAGFNVFKASQSTTKDQDRINYTKHMLRFRHISTTVDSLKVGDSIFEIALVNSHDGSSAYNLIAGVYRLTCSNGMCVSDSMLQSVHVRHTGNVVRGVIDGSTELVKSAPRVLDAIGTWRALPLTIGEQNAFAQSAHVLRFGDSEGVTHTAITPTQLLQARRGDDQGNDLWRTFNRVQENSIRGGLRAWGRDANNRLRRTTTREVKGIDQDVKLNRALWQLAESMAKLKTGN